MAKSVAVAEAAGQAAETTEKVSKKRRPIAAVTVGADKKTLTIVGGPFSEYFEFVEFVANGKQDGVTMLPMRQVGPSKTYRSIQVGKVV